MSKTSKKPAKTDSKQSVPKAAKSKEAKETVKATKPVRQTPDKKSTNVEKTGRRDSKQGMLITLLERPASATVEEMAKTTGWQNHSVLGAISGVLKKRLGLTITSDKEERGRVYRVAGNR